MQQILDHMCSSIEEKLGKINVPCKNNYWGLQKQRRKIIPSFSKNNWGEKIKCATVIVLHCTQFKRFLTPNDSSLVVSVICCCLLPKIYDILCQNKRPTSIIVLNWVTCFIPMKSKSTLTYFWHKKDYFELPGIDNVSSNF